MKKTVQIVTVPINKVGWDKEDIIKSINKEQPIVSLTSASFGKFVADKLMKNTWQAQQLLVLSDNVQHGDISYHSGNRTHTYDKYSCTKNCKKVIASYPNIQGTLPLSKETIQEWIDNGIPKECSVKGEVFYTGNYVGKCNSCNKEYTAAKRWKYCKECSEKSIIIDSQGNLILEFAEKTLEKNFIKMASSALGSSNFSPEFKNWEFKAPITPTDEEIEEKARSFVKSGNYGDVDMTQSIMAESYQNGYKQALKDLGYNNE